MQDSSQAKHPTARNKGKELIILDNINTSANDELSSGRLPDHSPAKNSRARLRQRSSHCPTFNKSNGGTIRQVRRETGRGQNQPNEVPMNAFALHESVMPPAPPNVPRLRDRACTLHSSCNSDSKSQRHALFSPQATHP